MISIEYIAGFIDGEGCFSAHATQKASPSLTIVNTDEEVLNDIAAGISMNTGIKPNIKSRWQPKYPNSKPCYCLRIGPPILRTFLPMLIPHLRVKRFQAEVMLKLISIIPSVKGPHSQGESTETYAERQELVNKITWANQGCK